MNEILNQHYQAIVKRGLINKDTTINDFLIKFIEERHEMTVELSRLRCNYENNFKHEVIDTIATLTNMLIHMGYDVEELFKENIEHQKNRV